VGLPHDLIERPRPQTGGKGRPTLETGLRRSAEEIVAHGVTLAMPNYRRRSADENHVKDIIPYIFWPWIFVSIVILLRRRITSGRWMSRAADETPAAPITFGAPPLGGAVATETPVEPKPAVKPQPVPVAVMNPRPEATRSRSLAEAVEGIAMPCDLAPLIGGGDLDPLHVSFFTTGFTSASVGSALSEELGRLGFEMTPEDDQTTRAERGEDLVRVKMFSAALTSEAVMTEHHPSAPVGAVVVELKLD
jgi:hypothetical protein